MTYERSEFMKNIDNNILTNNQIKLIIDTEKYILKYCDENNYDIIVNYILNVKRVEYINDNDEILVFTINYDDFKYEYTIKSDGNELLFEIKLKDNRSKSIILSKITDFNTLIESMLNDNN